MPAALIPSPSQGEWHPGPLTVRGSALCIAAAVTVAVWVAAARYRKAGGRPAVIWDVAAWAVPFGLIGAALRALLDVAARLFPAYPSMWSIARAWDGALGVPGAVGLGALGAWIACRRAGVRLPPVAGAAAPAVAFGLAIASLGGWFSQASYGPPSGLPWAVGISPVHRVPGYENFATFHPIFLYRAVWCVAVGAGVIWVARRFALPGDRAFCLQLALTLAGICGAESLLVSPVTRLGGLRSDQWAEIITVVGAAVYLYRTRHRHGPDVVAPAPGSGQQQAPAGRAHGAPSAS